MVAPECAPVAHAVVLLGPGSDAEIAGHFRHLKHHLNDDPDVHLELRFDHELAHLVYAGADLLVMPSMFEPCGLRPKGRRPQTLFAESRDRKTRATS